MPRQGEMTENDVNLEILSQVIREAGRPVHINVLTRAAARAWLEAEAGVRHYAPGAQYQAGETVLFGDQRATVKSVQKGGNPVQGLFAVLALLLPDGTGRFMAAEVPEAPAEDRQPVTEARVEEDMRTQGAAPRRAVRAALVADPRFAPCQTLQGDLWCLAEMLPQVRREDLRKAQAAFPEGLVDEEPVSCTTEELVSAVWGLEDDGSDAYALHAFALRRALDGLKDVVSLGDRWTSAQAWEAFTTRQTLDAPRMSTKEVPLPDGIDAATEAQIEQEQRREAVGEDEELPGVEEPVQEDVETWRLDRPVHAVFTLRARHYHEGWLPLSKKVRRLFPPLASGRQEVVFHHHFGDESTSLRAFVDRDEGRIWVFPEMYETFRCHRIYPGARLRLSARNEREYDIATRETDRTDPIRVWRMWLDEEGRIEYEEHEEPRRYDVDDDVYVADVRFEDREALFRQAEEVGNSIFGLMYKQAVEWWEARGRQDLYVTADQLFEAVHFDEQGRMTSKASVAWELWRRLAFEPLGGGRYRFRPEFGDYLRSTGLAPRRRRRRHRRVADPVSECWAQVARLEGQDLHTLDQQRPFRVLGVSDNAVQILVETSGQTRTIRRREIEAAWEHLVREREITRTEIHRQHSNFNPAYVAAILAALPGVTCQIRPIRLTYRPPSEEPPALFPTAELAAPRSPELAEPVSECWAQIADLVGRQLHTLDRKRPFCVLEVGDSVLQIRVETAGRTHRFRRQKVEAAWKHIVREGDILRTEIRDQYTYGSPYVAAILAALPGVTYQTRPIRLTYQPPSEEPPALLPPAEPAALHGPEPAEPVSEFWSQVAGLVGREFRTLGEGAVFDVLDVSDRAVRIKVASGGNAHTVYRRELGSIWRVLTQRGELRQTAIHDEFGCSNQTYVATILAALPGVTYQTRPLRLIYRPPSEEAPISPMPERRVLPTAEEKPAKAAKEQLLSSMHRVRQLKSSGSRSIFQADDHLVWLRYSKFLQKQSHYWFGIPAHHFKRIKELSKPIHVLLICGHPQRTLVIPFEFLESVGILSAPQNKNGEWILYIYPNDQGFDLAIWTGEGKRERVGVTVYLNNYWFDQVCVPQTAHQRLTPSLEEASALAPSRSALERTRTGQLVAADLMPPGPLFEQSPQPLQPDASEPASADKSSDEELQSDIEAEFRQIQEIVRASLVGKTIYGLVRAKPNRIIDADDEGLTVAARNVRKLPWEWIKDVYKALRHLGEIETKDVQEGEFRSPGGYRCAFVFPLLARFAHIEAHMKPRRRLVYHKPEGIIHLSDAAETVASTPEADREPEPGAKPSEDTQASQAPGSTPASAQKPMKPPPPSQLPTPPPPPRRSRSSSKPLFSRHYLTHRIQDHPEWNVEVSEPFRRLRALYEEKRGFLPTLNEAQTEAEFIRPALEILGFAYIPQTTTRRAGRVQRPDYALFADDETKAAAYPFQEDNEPAFYARAMAIADAKYWERSLSEARRDDPRDVFKNSNPSFQIVNYLTGTGVDWGILTNGRHWRLYYRQASSTATEFYEVDLVYLLESGDLEQFKYFWLFFRRVAFIRDAQGRNFLERVQEGSATYARMVGDRLKERVFAEVFPYLAGGFVAYRVVRGRYVSGEVACRAIYEATLSLLYKILFLLYAEARHLLPIDNAGYRAQSLTWMAREVAERMDRAEPLGRASTALYDHVLNLFCLIDRGDPGLGLPRYNGGLFHFDFDGLADADKRRPQEKHAANWFLTQHKIADAFLAPALDLLYRANGEPVDYGYIGVRHLGAIYEGLLEHRLAVDDAAGAQVHLETDKAVRKATGSYYTPDYIVKYIVRHTLGPILEQRAGRFDELMGRIAGMRRQLADGRRSASIHTLRGELDRLERQARESLLDIKICDPAMGSGHFLVEAVDFLTDGLIEVLNRYPEHNPVLALLDRIRREIVASLQHQGISIDPARLDDTQLLQRVVMKRCIYGVDLNPMAVELAKVSLWLHSFTTGAPLSFLDHHLRCGNSLIGAMAQEAHEQLSSEMPLFGGPFAGLLRAAEIMRGISILSDATFAEVEESERLFRQFDEAAKPYKRLLDIFVARHFGVRRADEFLRLYGADAIQAGPESVGQPYAEVMHQARQLYEEKRFFHWDLEFPEVFIDLERATWKENPGFDVVVGNPPYVRSVRLKEADPTAWAYYARIYRAAAKREFDIYLCFAEQGLRLLNLQGHFGMIMPNKWFTTRVGESLRSLLSERQAVEHVVDFGHFQVFEGVTTYACLLLLSGSPREGAEVAVLDRANENAQPIPEGKGKWHTGSILSETLGADAWSFALGPAGSLLTKLRELPRLEDITTVFKGTGTSADQVFLMKRQGDRFYSRSLERWVEIEVDLMRPSLTGRDIDPYYYETDNYLLFAYRLVGEEVHLIPPEEMAAKYPKAWAYLNHPTNREGLEGRDRGAFRNRDDWYAYGRPQNMHLLELDKVIGPDVAGRAEFACDFEGRHIIDTVYAIRPREGVRISLLALAALLNSSVMTFFLQQTGTKLRGGYFRMKTAYLNPFPLPRIAFTTPADERARLVEEGLNHEEREMERMTRNVQGPFVPFASFRAFRDSRLGHWLDARLSAQPEQSDVIHDLLAHLAGQMIEMNKEKQAEVKGFLAWLEREIGAPIDNLTRKTHLRQYLGDYQKGESHRALEEVLDILRRNRRRLKVDPSERAFQEQLAGEYEGSLGKLLPLKARLAGTDRLIDLIVYRLYGLTEEEVAVVEGTE